MLVVILFGLFIGNMSKETYIQKVCEDKNAVKVESVQKLCSKQLSENLP